MGQAKDPKALQSAQLSLASCLGGQRCAQVYLMAATRFLCYLTRGQIGVILPYLTEELALSQKDAGQLLSRYAGGYMLTQIVGGVCADQYGAAPVVAIAIALSSCLSLLAAGTEDVGMLGAVMFMIGLVQGVVMPAGNVLVAQWVLPSERSWASGLGGIGACLGALTVNIVATPVAEQFGWRSVFLCTSCFTIVLGGFWIALAASRPVKGRTLPAEMHVLVAAGVLATKPKPVRLLPPSRVMCRGCVWVLFAAHFTQNSQQYFMDWIPSVYHELQLPAASVALHLGVIASVELPARAVAQHLPQRLASSQFSLLQSRQCMSIVGFALHGGLYIMAGALLSAADSESTVWLLTTSLAAAKASQALHAGGYFANYLDLTREYTGLLAGLGNTIATVSGIFMPQYAAWTFELSGGSYQPAILSLVVADIAAAVLIHLGMSVDCLD
eukprot:SAG31_NODE_1228_length_9228_cov_5.337386_4_plen_442_part_00